MKDNKGTLGRKALASVGAAALGLVGVVGLTTTAFAATGNIDPEAASSLTIHKYIGLPVTGGVNNGTELGEAPSLDVAQGVKFTVQEVGVLNGAKACVALDVTKAADWDLITAAYNTDPDDWGTDEGDYCFTGVKWAENTDQHGELTFDSGSTPTFGQGFYYVTETDSSGALIPGTPDEEVTIVQPVEPFFVTVPFPSYAGTGSNDERVWTYDVHVYPKNQTSDAPVKTITSDPSGLVVGSTVEWTITVPIPNTKDPLTQASVYDQLDSRLEYVQNSADVTIGGDTSFKLEPTTGGTASLEWKFEGANLTAVNNARSETGGANIVVTFETKVVSVGTDGKIENKPDKPGNGYGSKFNETPNPGETTPVTYWGELKILKTDDGGTNAKNLQGAEFAVVAKGTEACDTTVGSQNTVATGTSDVNGVVQWGTPGTSPLGLWIGNYDVAQTSAPSKAYCVYETQPPAGYTAAAVRTVTIIAGELSTTNGGNITVVNSQKAGPNLPLTGANGTVLMTIGGLALIALAGGTYIVSRRRQQTEA